MADASLHVDQLLSLVSYGTACCQAGLSFLAAEGIGLALLAGCVCATVPFERNCRADCLHTLERRSRQ